MNEIRTVRAYVGGTPHSGLDGGIVLDSVETGSDITPEGLQGADLLGEGVESTVNGATIEAGADLEASLGVKEGLVVPPVLQEQIEESVNLDRDVCVSAIDIPGVTLEHRVNGAAELDELVPDALLLADLPGGRSLKTGKALLDRKGGDRDGRGRVDG